MGGSRGLVSPPKWTTGGPVWDGVQAKTVAAASAAAGGGGGVTRVATYKWESEVTSLKMPSGSSEMSLPWRDLRGERGETTVCFFF